MYMYKMPINKMCMIVTVHVDLGLCRQILQVTEIRQSLPSDSRKHGWCDQEVCAFKYRKMQCFVKTFDDYKYAIVYCNTPSTILLDRKL